MNSHKKTLFLLFISCVITITISVHSSFSSRIVFCDVGQGAATLLQLGTYQILVDTGPDKRVLSCIGHHIPFFDHQIEVVIISHPQKDHNGGLQALQKKYKVLRVYEEIKNTIFLQIKNVGITIHKASSSSKDINESANVVTIRTPSDVIFLTSDINGIQLKGLIPPDTTILEAPHHGSKYGLYPDSLDLAEIRLAVISVGKRNTYGHPSKEALAILKAKGIPIWRTDEKGELVVKLKL